MKPNKNIRLPFFFITSLSIALMVVIIYTHYQADKSINGLRKGNTDAVNVFKVHVLADEIINGIYTVELGAASLSDAASYTHLKDTIEKIKANTALLNNIIVSAQNDENGKKFVRLIYQKLHPFDSLLSKSTGNYTKLQEEAKIISSQTRPLTDSLYFSAIDLEDGLSNYLQKNIAGNEKLAIKVSQIDLMLTFIIIISIAILATIIILRLLQNFRLIKEVHAERLEAEKAAKVKEQFLANMSHEIRTPINSVVGFTNLLQRTGLKEDQQQYVSLIKTAGENLLSIVNDILDISKIEAGMLHFDKSPFSIKEICYNIEMMFQHKAMEKDLALRTIIAEDVPPMVTGDKERLFQVLMNLTSNAVKFTQHGEIKISVNCKTAGEHSAILIFAVEDTGVGINRDKLDIIFERFEQAEKDTTRKFGGTGLGLAIVKSLVTMQGGHLNVYSEEGKGARFEFEIEYGISKAPTPGTGNTYISKDGGSVFVYHPSFENKKILIAEDNKMNQLLLKTIFKQVNLAATITENGQEAVEAIQKEKYDLVLMDIQMPVMDGYTATQKIRNELNLSTPVIAMTAKVLPGEKEKCIKAGMNDYLSKPINEEYFYNLLLGQFSAGGNHADTRQLNTPVFVNENFLYNIFNSHKAVTEITRQFLIQFPQELLALGKAVHEKDISKIKRLSHLMLSTVNAVNNTSPLRKYLMEIENADDTPQGWLLISAHFSFIDQNKKAVTAQAEELLNKANKHDQ